MTKTAGIIIIGNEILTGKTADANSHYLAKILRARGVTLRRVWVVPDEFDDIIEIVREAAERCDYVFTSGGVGPTHDDITVEAIARALGRELEVVPEIAALLEPGRGRESHPGDPPPGREARMRMALAPAGFRTVATDRLRFPVIAVEPSVTRPQRGQPAPIYGMGLGNDGRRFSHRRAPHQGVDRPIHETTQHRGTGGSRLAAAKVRRPAGRRHGLREPGQKVDVGTAGDRPPAGMELAGPLVEVGQDAFARHQGAGEPQRLGPERQILAREDARSEGPSTGATTEELDRRPGRQDQCRCRPRRDRRFPACL